MGHEEMTFTQELVITLFASGIVGSLVSYVLYRKKGTAEVVSIDAATAASQVATAMLLVENYKKEYGELLENNSAMKEQMTTLKEQIDTISDQFAISMQELRKENQSLKQDNQDLAERVQRLEAQVISLGGHPVTRNKRKGD